MSDVTSRVVRNTFIEILCLTSLGPIVYYFTRSDWILMFWLSFNAALNIVGYEYAVRAYLAAAPIAKSWEDMKNMYKKSVDKPPTRWQKLSRWLSKHK